MKLYIKTPRHLNLNTHAKCDNPIYINTMVYAKESSGQCTVIWPTYTHTHTHSYLCTATHNTIIVPMNRVQSKNIS